MPTANTSAYERRDALLLRHVALYRLTLPAIVRSAFFGGKEPGHVLKRLCDLGQLLAHLRSLPGGLTYYLLTPSGCALANAPKERAESFQGAAFELALGVLTFCFLGRVRRYRLEPTEVETALGCTQPPNVPFVVTDELGSPCVLRIVQGATGTPQQLVRQLGELADKLADRPDLERRLATGELGFGVLAPTAQKCLAIEKAASQSRVGKELTIVVDVGATAESVALLLKGRGA